MQKQGTTLGWSPSWLGRLYCATLGGAIALLMEAGAADYGQSGLPEGKSG